MRIPRIIPILFLFLACLSGAYAQWPNGYAYSGSVTVAHGQVPNTDQANFPVLVSGTYPDLATTANGGKVTNPSGYDIIFASDANGLNRLNFERQSYSQNGQVTFWVQVPVLSHTADTVFYVFYGNSSVTTDQSGSAAWDSHYMGVWHLDGNPALAAPQELDSTSNGNSLSAIGSWSASNSIAGKIGNAISSSNNNGFAGPGRPSLTPTTALTLGAWIKINYGGFAVIADQYDTSGLGAGYYLIVDGVSNALRFKLSAGNNGGSPQTTWESTAGNVNDGNWHYVAATYTSGVSVGLFVDGVAEPMTGYVNGVPVAGAGAGFYGSLANTYNFLLAPFDNYYYQGIVDEVRISNAVRSGDWIAAEYANQNSPATFYSTVWGHTSGSAPTPGVSVSTTSLTYTGTAGGSNPAAQSVNITNSGGGTLSWTASVPGNQTWMTLSTTANGAGSTSLSGTGAQTIFVQVASSGLSAGPYSAAVTISASGASPASQTVNVSLTVAPSVPTGAWPNGYTYSGAITVLHGQVPNTDQTNFPVLVSGTYSDLATTGNGGKVTNPNGYDIIFASDANGLNRLNFERQSYAANGQVAFWVQMPLLSHTTDTVFYVFYGNSAVATDQSTKTAVWDSSYLGVWHMSDNAASRTVTDSTSHSNNGTNLANTNAKSVAGQFGTALTYDGNVDYTDLGGATGFNLTSNFTAEVWTRPGSIGGDVGALSKINSSSGNGFGVILDSNAWKFHGSGGYLSAGPASAGTWHHLVATVSASGNRSIYYDGVLKNTDPNSVGASTSDVVLGSFYANLPSGSGYNYNGTIQEARISNTTRSADWVATEYHNQSSPVSFYSPVWGLTSGAVQSPGLSVSTTTLTYSIGVGSNPAAQSVNITNSGGGTLSWTASVPGNQAWMTLSTTANGAGSTSLSGTGPQTIFVQVASNSLSAGPYSSAVTISASGASPASQTVNVSLTIVAAPGVSVSTTSLTYTGTSGGSNPAAQSVGITNSGGGTLSWTASVPGNQTWMTLSTTANGAGSASLSGTGPQTIFVQVASSSLGAGPYSSAVTISASGASPASQTVNVSLTVGTTAAPGVSVSTTSLTYTGTAGGSNPAAQSVNITNSGGGTLSWTASVPGNQTWMTLSTTANGAGSTSLSGTGPQTIFVQVASSSLSAGPYSSAVTISASGASPASQTVNVSLTVGAGPGVSVSTTSLTYTGTAGGSNPAAQSVNITNSGGGTLSWTASVPGNQTWMTLSTTANGAGSTSLSGTGPQTIFVQVASSSLSAGPYSSAVTISASGASPASQTVNVSLTVGAGPGVSVSTTSLTYTGTAGGSNPAAQSVNITNSGGGTLSWTASVPGNQTWMTLSTTANGAGSTSLSGTGAQTIFVQVASSGLSAGPYSAAVTISASGASPASQTVNVSLTVAPSVPTGAWPNGYTYSGAITVLHGQVPNTDQTNFPVLVSGTYSDLATTGNGGKVTNPNGYDIIFASDANGLNRLNFERQSYAANGQVAFWVQMPLLSHTTDTVFYVFYGNSAVATDQSTKTAVWDSSYLGVWHMSDNAASRTVTDSTSHSNNGTNLANTNAKSVAGQFGTALTYDGNVDYTDLGGATGFNLTSNFTAEVWTRPGSIGGDVGALSKINSSSGNGFGVILDSNAWKFHGSGGYLSAGPASAGTWHHLVATVSASGNRSIYYDGVLKNTDPNSVGASTSDVVLGSFYANLPSGSGYNYNGTIQEARISNTTRSADWVATEYHNQSSPVSFYSPVWGLTSTVPGVAASQLSLTYTGTSGASNPAAQSVNITNSGGGTLSWTASVPGNQTWMTLSTTANGAGSTSLSGTGPQTIFVQVASSSLSAGPYSSAVTISAPGASPASQTVNVSLTVGTAPGVSVSTTSLTYATGVGSTPAAQSVNITNSGGATLNWTASVPGNQTWMTLSTTANGAGSTSLSGTGPQTIFVQVVSSSLGAGPYSSAVTISAPGASPASQTVNVSLTVAAAPGVSVSTTSLTYTGTSGGSNPATQSVGITNSGGGTLSWTASVPGNQTWMTLSTTANGAGSTSLSGTGPQTIFVQVASSSLSAGPYSSAVTISASGASPASQTVNVSLTVGAGPGVSVSTTSLTYTGTAGGSNPAAQSLGITNSGGGTLSWTASVPGNQTWMTLSTTANGAGSTSLSGTGPQTIFVQVASSSLSAGPYSSAVTVSASGASPASQTVNVSLTVGAGPGVSVSTTSLTYTGTSGGSNPAAQSVNITNSGGGTLSWTASVPGNQTWMTLSTTANGAGSTSLSGTGAQTIFVQVASSSLTAGPYSSAVTISASGASPASQTVNVSLTVGAGPGVSVSTTSLTYAGTAGGSNPAAQSVNITNSGGGTLSWTASVPGNQTWMTLSTTANGAGSTSLSGTGAQTIFVQVASNSLSAGPYSSAVTISATGASPASQTVNVSLTVQPPPIGIWPNGYSYSGIITVPHGQVSNTDQTNFPVLVSGTYSDLATTANGGRVTNPNGYDIVFASDTNGLNRLNFERQSYAANGQVAFWVQMPVLSHTTDTVFYVFYGNSGVTTDQSTKTAVWDSSYLGVWHLDGDPSATAPQELDSTSNINPLNANGSWASANLVAGEINKGISSNGNFGFNSAKNLSPKTAFTLEAWIKINYGGLPTIMNQFDSSGLGAGYTFSMDGTANRLRLTMSAGNNGGSTQTTWEANSGNVNDGNWHKATATYLSGSGVTFYVDGSPVTTTGTSFTGSIGSSAGFSLIPLQSYAYQGTIDEARLSNIARSPDWILTQYQNEVNSSSFAHVLWGQTSGIPAPQTPPSLTTSPAAPLTMTYFGTVSTNPAPQPVTIVNAGGGALNWTATASQPWITLSASAQGQGSSTLTGSGGQTIWIQVASTSLGLGSDLGAITILAPGASPSSQTISVNLTVTPPAGLSATPLTLTYSGTGFNNPAAQSVNISNSGGGTLAWTASVPANLPWITLSTTANGSGSSTLSGAGPQTIWVRVASAGMTIGSYPGTVNLTAPGATPSSQVVNVSLSVIQAPALSTWSNGYTYSGTFTVPHALVPNTDQINFPVLISGTFADLATTTNGGRVTNPNGYDIIFTSDANGVNQLNFERELYSAANGQVMFWVQVPTLSHTADTPIYVFYGNSSVTADPSNKSGTWDSHYLGVWHLDGNPGGSAPQEPDSTSNSNHLSANGSWAPANLIAGEINNGISSNGNLGFNAAKTLAPTTALTVGAWIKINYGGLPTIMNQFDSSGLGAGYTFSMDGTANRLRLTMSAGNNGGSTQTTWEANSGNVNDGNWHYATATYSSGSGITFYVDGNLVTTTGASFTGNVGAATSGFSLIPLQSYAYQGMIDEARVSNIARSADWISTEYHNQSNPPSFAPVALGQPLTLNYTNISAASNPAPQSMNISNSGGGTLSWTATANQSWITLSTTANGPGSASLTGTGPQTIWIQVAGSSMNAGSYPGTVTFTAPGAIPSTQTVNVALTVLPPPTVSASPLTVTYTAALGSSSAAQSVNISNAGAGTLNWTATANQPWITLATTANGTGSSTLTGTGSQTIWIQVASNTMSVGTTPGSVTVSSLGPPPSSQNVSVSVTITPAPGLSASPSNLTYSGTSGSSNPAAQSVSITNSGGGTLNWTATANQNWISLATTANGVGTTTLSGTGAQTLWIKVASSALSAGPYQGSVTLAAPGASPSSQTINVSLSVAGAPPALSVFPLSLTYFGVVGFAGPPAQSFNITDGTLSWTASVPANQPWITLATSANGAGSTTLTGSGAQTIWLQVSTNGLTAGSYTGTVTISSPGATPSSQPVSVTFTVVNPSPVGYWTMDFGTLVNGEVLDESPYHLNGTAPGGVTVVPGVINMGFSFNGTSGYIGFLPDTLTDLTGNASLALWVKTTNTSNLEALISRFAAGGAGTGYLLRLTPSGHAELVIGGNNNANGVELTITDSKVINDNQWHHVAAVMTIGQGASIYVDGVLSTTQVANLVATSGASPLLLGVNGWVPYGTYFNGILDDTRLYNRALLASEIATLATPSAITSPPPPGPALSISPATFLFSAVSGAANPPEQPAAVANVGGGTLNWTATADESWIALSSTANGTTSSSLSGTGNQSVWIQVLSSALPSGSYSGTITVTAPGSTPPSQTISVSLTIVPQGSPSLSVLPLNLFFSSIPGGGNPVAQSLTLTNAGQGTLAGWTANASQPWITLSSTAGTGAQPITVGANVSGLGAGTFNGTVTVTAPGAAPSSSQTVYVTLAIVAPTSSSGNGQTLYNGIVLPQQWPPVGTQTQAYSIPSYITSPPAVIPIDVGRQLFVDDFLVQQSTLVRTQHQPVMFAGNPIISASATDTAGLAMPFSDGAWFDPSDHLFKMWYFCGSTNVPATCYAYSSDGMNWTKPSIPDAMVPNTNHVLPNPGGDSTAVWMDLQDPNPAHKFKAFEFQGPANMGVYFSADGIHWTSQQTQYSIDSISDRTTLFWNPFRNVWVDSMRDQVLVPGTQNRQPYPSDRVRYYAESPDLLNWKPSDFLDSFWTGADENDPPYVAGGALPQLYNLDAVAYESTLVGLFSWLNPGPADPTNDPNNAAGPALVELGVGFSRDGFNWVRPNRGGGPSNAFIPASNAAGTWNMGNTQSTGGGFLVVGNELWFYFSGRNGPHGHETAGSTGLAKLRRDGFYSMNAGATQGVLVTRPVKFTGKFPFVNVKDPQGSLQVEILDVNNNVIAPFSAQNSIALSVDSTLEQVTWSGVSDLSSLIGQTVKFRFYLTNGELYSFWVSSNANGASNGYVAAGGPGFTGNIDTVGSGSVSAVIATPTQTLSVSTASLSFSATAGANDPPFQSFNISDLSGTLSWTATASQGWVTLSPTSGTGSQSIVVAPTIAGLAAGTYHATVTILAPGATPSAIQVPISLVVGSGSGTVTGVQHYASPSGSSFGDGSVGNPWDLQTALNQPSSVHPGDTIWLRNGVYGDGTGTTVYTSSLNGTATQPIIVRQYPGERATVDGGITVNGSNTWFWGFEVTNLTALNRVTGIAGETGPNFPDALDVFGPGSKLINLVLHDRSQGVGFWTPSQTAEIYGSIIYNNGWQGSDRGHGHGIYTQNQTGVKTIADNIIFQGFGFGIQAYGSTAAYVQNYVFDGNTIFNSGALNTGNALTYNLLVGGGGTGPQNITVTNNFTYNTPSIGGGQSSLGDFGPLANNLTATGNYWMGGSPALAQSNWIDATFTNNTLYSPGGYLLFGNNLSPSTYVWDTNTYYGSNLFQLNAQNQSFSSWQALTGLDSSSVLLAGSPGGTWVFVRPNRYEQGRANITVYNWNLASLVSVDLSSVLAVGSHFQILNAQNFYGPPVVSGTYAGGPITIPMTGLTVAAPIGNVGNQPASTGPQFGAFVVVQQ